jgi:hypothetical protein
MKRLQRMEPLTDEQRIDYLCELAEYTCGQWQIVIESDAESFMDALDAEAKRAHGIWATTGEQQ